MSWHFLQEQEAVCWADHNLDGAPDALLRLIPTLENAYWRDKETDVWSGSQSGTTLKHLMEATGEAQSISSAVDSHAKTYLPLDGGGGIAGEKSGLWKQMARIIGEVRPRFVFVENSPLLVVRGLGTVIGDLSSMGYDSRWGIVGAHHAGANHFRDRIWILAYSNSPQREGGKLSSRAQSKNTNAGFSGWWETEPNVGRVVDGLAARLDQSGTDIMRGGSKVQDVVPNRAKRLKAIGNGQVPAAMMIAWKTLTQDL